MSYRLVDANKLALVIPEVNTMPCIYADLPNGLDNEHYDLLSRPTGHWIWKTEDKYQCSCCGEVIRVKEVMNEPQYIACPMCDVRMVEPQERSE